MTKPNENTKARFLEALAETCNVTLACRAAGISNSQAYSWRKEDALFEERWAYALDEGIDLLEAEAHRRAFQGTTKPVFFQGGECGEIREYSDGLAQFLLKAHRPEKYRERSQVDSNITGATSVTVLTGVPSDSDVSDIL